MTAKQFRESQSRIGCTGAQLHRWTGLSREQISRFRCDKWKVPAYMAFIMKALEAGVRPE